MNVPANCCSPRQAEGPGVAGHCRSCTAARLRSGAAAGCGVLLVHATIAPSNCHRAPLRRRMSLAACCVLGTPALRRAAPRSASLADSSGAGSKRHGSRRCGRGADMQWSGASASRGLGCPGASGSMPEPLAARPEGPKPAGGPPSLAAPPAPCSQTRARPPRPPRRSRRAPSRRCASPRAAAAAPGRRRRASSSERRRASARLLAAGRGHGDG